MNQKFQLGTRRLELDVTATGWNHTNALALAIASEAAYLKEELLHLYFDTQPRMVVADPVTDTHAIVVDFGNAAVVAVRGTDSPKNLLEDFDARKAWMGCGRVHAGFWRGMQGIVDRVKHALVLMKRRVVLLGGHSYGGAVATDLARQLEPLGTKRMLDGMILHSIYTFGSPRTADHEYARRYNAQLGRRTIRVTRRADVIPWAPPWLDGYRHVGRQIHFDRRGMHDVCPLAAELLTNGREIARELLRGRDALLDDHHIGKYVEDVAHLGGDR